MSVVRETTPRSSILCERGLSRSKLFPQGIVWGCWSFLTASWRAGLVASVPLIQDVFGLQNTPLIGRSFLLRFSPFQELLHEIGLQSGHYLES